MELVFPYHLGSLFKLLKMELDSEFRLQKRHTRDSTEEGSVDAYVKQVRPRFWRRSKLLYKYFFQIENAIFDLQLIETSMQNSKIIFGLKFLNREERTYVVKKIVRMVRSMLDCLHEMRQKPDHYHYYRGKCFHVSFRNIFGPDLR